MFWFGRVASWGTGLLFSIVGHSDSSHGAWWWLRRWRCGVSVLVVGFFVVTLIGPSGALASGEASWAPGVEATPPSNGGADAQVESVSCAAAGGCSAVGWYGDSSNDIQGLLVSGNSGKWGPGVEATMPTNASSDPSPSFGSVSCTSTGNCTAVGSYSDSSGDTQGLLLTESGGVWRQGVEAVLPANAASNPNASLSSVSCSSPGSCTAVGVYVDSSNSPEGLLLSEHSGVWSNGVEAILPGNVATGGTGISDHGLCDPRSPCVNLTSVSCAAAGECAAVGSYNASSVGEEGLLLNETSGVWTQGVEAALPATPFTSPNANLSSVSCVSAGDCSAVGSYNGSGSGQGLLVSENSGRWATGIEATPPAGAAASSDVVINSVSCSSPGDCAAGGSYDTSGNDWEGLLLSESQDRWAPGEEAVLPANAVTNPAISVTSVSSVSCASAGNCAAVGVYLTSSPSVPQPLLPASQEGLLLSESSGVWSPGVEASLPANAASTDSFHQAAVSSVSCTPTGNCAAGGYFLDNSGNPQGLLLTGTLALLPHNTTITRARINGKRQTGSFFFTATNATTFECALIKHKAGHHTMPKVVFRSCSSPKTYEHLKPGQYTFEVRGVNSPGTVDPTAATKNFTLQKQPLKHRRSTHR